MDLIWDKIPEMAGISDEMAGHFNARLDELRASIQKHRFSTKDKADIFLGAVHGDDQEEQDQGRYLANIFIKWREYDEQITLPELLSLACDFFEIDRGHDLLPATLTACVLGEIPHPNAYHDNFHFREVFAIMMRFCAYHNASRTSPSLKLSSGDILLMLMAAAIHDFAHNGSTNFKDGVYTQARMEKRSVRKATPYLEAAGIHEELLRHLEVMIICTDVTRNEEGRSPAGMARDIYLAHEHGTLSLLVVPSFLELLVQNHKLALMTRMLCEADITPSSGISYSFSKNQTKWLSEENPAIQPAASTLYVFMEVICHGGYDTPAAKALFGAKFREILQAVRNDSVNGIIYS